jgi:hypothetical protein
VLSFPLSTSVNSRSAGTGLAYHNIRKAQAAEPVLAEIPASAPETTPPTEATTAGGG